MKQISLWAKTNVFKARLAIIIIYILLVMIGIYIGRTLNEMDINIPQPYMTGCIIVTILLWIIYPDKNRFTNTYSASFEKRKVVDFSLGLVTLLMIICTANNKQRIFIKSESATASKVIRYKDSSLNNNPLIQNFINAIRNKDVSRMSEREKIKMIKHQLQEIKKDKETSKGNKTLLIILSVLIALALLFGLAVLSCSIACSSSGALALIVALAGTFLIVFFLIRIIKRISHPKPKTNVQ